LPTFHPGSNQNQQMKNVLVVAICLLGMLVSCTGKKKESKTTSAKQQQPPTIVEVLIVSPQTISNTIEANGSVVASEFIEIKPEVGGRITYLNVSEGSPISKGSVVAKINDADLRAQLSKVRVQLALAETTVDRYKKLLDIQGINRADYDVAVNQANSLRADIQILQANIAKTVLRAPFSGVVGLRQASIGAIVSPASVIATLQKVDKVKIDFTLPETYANLVKRGSHVAVEIDRNEASRRRATILAIEPQINSTTRNVIVRAALEGAGLNPGRFVKVFLDACRTEFC